MGKAGRKNKYETHVQPYLKKIPSWYLTMTESQIAEKLGITIQSWIKYKKEYPELQECLQSSRDDLIIVLKDTLKKKAQGFHYKETKKIVRECKGEKEKVVEEHEKYAQPDTGAIHLLLKNLDHGWHNDDKETMELKRQQVALQERKLDAEDW